MCWDNLGLRLPSPLLPGSNQPLSSGQMQPDTDGFVPARGLLTRSWLGVRSWQTCRSTPAGSGAGATLTTAVRQPTWPGARLEKSQHWLHLAAGSMIQCTPTAMHQPGRSARSHSPQLPPSWKTPPTEVRAVTSQTQFTHTFSSCRSYTTGNTTKYASPPGLSTTSSTSAFLLQNLPYLFPGSSLPFPTPVPLANMVPVSLLVPSPVHLLTTGRSVPLEPSCPSCQGKNLLSNSHMHFILNSKCPVPETLAEVHLSPAVSQTGSLSVQPTPKGGPKCHRKHKRVVRQQINALLETGV